MPAVEAKEKIERQLQEAIDRLRADLVRVEIWASALNGFSRPIPEYQAVDEATRHQLPRRSDERNSEKHRERADSPQPAEPRGNR
jgi:hypothetical protein